MTLDAASIPKIAGFRFDPQTTESIWWCIEREAVRLVGEQGLHAFEMPRSSAVAHETGHAIVAVHDGVALSYVEITRRYLVFNEGAPGIVLRAAMSDARHHRHLFSAQPAGPSEQDKKENARGRRAQRIHEHGRVYTTARAP
jgi:hypothetical protein